MQNTSKRQPRGTRPAKPAPVAPGDAAPRHKLGPRPTTVALVERIVDLQIRQPPLETFASEILPPLLDAFGAPAGAILLYHCETETLALVASRGLSPAGLQHLEQLRRGAADSWEIPLHGLLNRKAYIIERPDEHPFVPELIAREVMPRNANLASIPLYRGQLPVGVLLAVADRRAIAESEILTQVLAFDALALALDGYLRARALAAAPALSEGADGPVVCAEWVEPLERAARLQVEIAGERAARDELAARLADAEAWVTATTAAVETAKGDYARLLAERAIEIDRARGSERQLSEATLAELREELAARDATLAARDDSLAAIAAQRDRAVAGLTEDRDRARDAANAAGDLAAQLRATVAALESERATLRTAQSAALARVGSADAELARLGSELAELRGEAARLRDDRARVLAAVDEPGAEPATVIRALREKVAALESEVGAFAGERAEWARRGAAQAEKVAQQIAQQRRELEELRATHEHAVTELAAAHARALDDARTAEQRALAETVHDRRRILEAAEERQQTAIAALRAEHAEALTQALAERDARRNELERVTAQCDDLEARLACALAEREEAAAAASVRERAAVARLEAEQRAAAVERQTLQHEVAAGERMRAEHAERLAGLEREVAARDEHATALARTIDERDAQLAAIAAEVARLREDRERVLAVVDDPGAEPAAVIQALRERVAGFESELQGVEDARAQAAQRAAAELEQTEHRLAVQRRELAEARAAHRAELETTAAAARRESEQAQADHRREREQDRELHAEEITALRAAADRLEAERRAMLTRIENDRDAAHATITELRAAIAARESALSERVQALANVETERTRLAEAVATAAAERERVATMVAALEHDRAVLGERVAALERADAEHGPRLAALITERERQETEKAEVEARAEQLATELAVVQAEALRLREDRARVLAAVDDETAEPATVLRALREQVAALEGQLAAHAAERIELARRADAEARTIAERSAIERAEREAADTEHQRAFATAQAAHVRALEDAAALRRRELEHAAATHRRGLEEVTAAHQRAVAEQQAAVTRLEAQRRAAVADAEAARRALADERGSATARLADVRAARLSAESDVRAVRLAADTRTPYATSVDVEDLGSSMAQQPIATGDDATAADDAGGSDADLSDATNVKAVASSYDAMPAPMVEVVSRGGHHILEADAARWEQIHTAFTAALPATAGRTVMIANLLAAFPAGLYDLTAAATAGATLIGYAADAHGRSRILGAVRCFADPPTAEESAAVFDTMPKGPRRVLTLSDDVEAFIGAKTGLAKAGHSVSMACDAKQALDLLAMFTPDAVFIDLRTAPTAAAEFLAALAPESGRVLVVLVHGDPAGNVLPCVIQRLLRPTPLDPADLVNVCRNILAAPPPAGAPKSAPVKAIRPFERPQTAARKPVPRRLIPRRR